MTAGASYLPWLAGTLEEHPGEGYWLSFNQRLPISYELGDCLYGLLHRGQLVRDEEDAECQDMIFFNFLIRPILHSFLEHSPFTSLTISL